MSENVREIILDTLLALERGEDFSHRLIRGVLDKYDYWDARDKAFFKRVTEGTLERQIELDYYLNSLSTVPVKKMKPLIRTLLRMSVYQILFLDAVPDSAVCNEACKLASKRKFHNLKGFVNGVLRNVSRQKEALSLPDREKDPAGYLSVRYSVPKWLVSCWMVHYGEETAEKIMEGLLEIHPVSLRLRRSADSRKQEQLLADWEAAGVQLHKTLHPQVYFAENVENVAALPGFAEGAFTVQDVSSVLAVEAAGIRPGDFVMDLCAAPGGKSMLAAELASGDAGCVLSRDVSFVKTQMIEENISRMGYQNITVEVHDATVFDDKYREKADVVLVDVPCSGLGVIGKKRDIKYRIKPEDLTELIKLQKEIVENSWRYVKPGGVLLYSTCTINPGENGEMVRWIENNLPFSLEEERQFLPGYDHCDGFFYARLRREE